MTRTNALSTTEEEGCQRSCQRPEGRRPVHPGLRQEGGLPRQLPRHQLQPPERRQAPRDEVVNVRGGRGFGSDCGGNLTRGAALIANGRPHSPGDSISLLQRGRNKFMK